MPGKYTRYIKTKGARVVAPEKGFQKASHVY